MILLMKKTFYREEEIKKDLIEFIKDAKFFSVSEQCSRFEEEFADYHNKKFSVLFNSGGSANFAMLQALKNLGKLKAGDKAGFSSLTWSTNVMPIIQMGLEPIALDCDMHRINTMADEVERKIDEFDIKVFFATNVLGMCGDMDNIRQVCKDREVIFLEDNCESLGTIFKGERLGTFSQMSSCSFFVAHHMSTIEGGAVLTDDDDLYEMLIIIRSNGWDRNLTKERQDKLRKKYKIKDEFQASYSFYDIGFNFKPTEITGFLARKQLEILDEALSERKDLFHKINQFAIENNNLIKLNYEGIDTFAPFAFPVVTKNEAYREILIERFAEAEVEIRPMIAGNMQNQPFYSKYVETYLDVPGTEHIDKCGFYFGIYPELTSEDIDIINRCLSS